MSWQTPPWESREGATAVAPKQTGARATFKTGTLGLMRAMRWENDARFLKAADEAYLVHEVVVAIGNYMYAELGAQEYKTAKWRIPAEILAAGRQALPDHAGTSAAEDLAYLLVRAQADDAAVHPYLHPWDRLAFTWRKQGLSGAKIAGLLRDSGLIDQMPDASVAELDGWIGAPVTALGRSYHILAALFGESRLTYVSLRDNGYENDHDKLFDGLMHSASPPVTVENVQQQLLDAALQEAGEAVHGMQVFHHHASWVVSFGFAGRQHQFTVGSKGTWMEVGPVLAAADRFLASIGRPDRVFQFPHSRGENGEWGMFMTMPAPTFMEVASRLELPLAPRG